MEISKEGLADLVSLSLMRGVELGSCTSLIGKDREDRIEAERDSIVALEKLRLITAQCNYGD